MSRATAHAYLEGVSGEVLDEATKDLYLNLSKAQVIADLLPWGRMHLADHINQDYSETTETTETIDTSAVQPGEQTEYPFPTNPKEIIALCVRRSTSAPYRTAKPVKPFQPGDPEAAIYTDEENPVYFVREGKIVVYPQFSSAVIAGIKVYFFSDSLDLSINQTNTGFSPSAEKLWAYKAAGAYYRAVNDVNRARLMEEGYERLLWAMKKTAPIAGQL